MEVKVGKGMVVMHICEAKIRVRYKETDQMGIVHHSNYYPWFEVARSEFMRGTGITYGELEEMGLMLPLLETHCYYKIPAKYDDQLTIRTWISMFNGVRLIMEYEVIRDEDRAVLARGSTVHAFTTRDLKPINIKKKFPEVYKIYQKLSGN